MRATAAAHGGACVHTHAPARARRPRPRRYLYLESRAPGDAWPAWHAGAVHVLVTPLIVNPATSVAVDVTALGRGAAASGSFGAPVQVGPPPAPWR